MGILVATYIKKALQNSDSSLIISEAWPVAQKTKRIENAPNNLYCYIWIFGFSKLQ